MITNVMETYKKYVGVFLKDFTKAFFQEQYSEKISNEYIGTYIESRYYNMGEKKERYFYATVYNNLTAKRDYLKQEYAKKYLDIIEDILKMYQFIFYIDGLRTMPDITEFSDLICKRRIEVFKLNKVKGLEKKFLKLIKGYIQFKENFLENYDCDNFELVIQKYTLIENTYKVELGYKFEFSYVYSQKVIDEVYNTGIVNEDKNMVAYMLLAVECIRDINNCNFDKKYLVDFANTLYDKKKKLNQTLRIINNIAIQDKIILKIQYKDFLEYKDDICELIGEGFKFAIILDDDFRVNMLELRKLDIFPYIIVQKEGKIFDKILDFENKINNIVIYDF